MASVDWTFEGSWPYQPSWFDAEGGRMHYVDAGPQEAPPVVLLHGNPTWGYVYRAFIPPLLAEGRRVVVPDLLGFGRSQKPPGGDPYLASRHAHRVEELLESLDLRGAVLVVHDWGGPPGLHWATGHPERVGGLFLMNTTVHGLWRGPGGERTAKVPLPLRLIRAPVLGEALVQGCDAFKPVMFRVAIERRERMTKTVRSAYRQVHADRHGRSGMLAFARQLPLRPGGAVAEMNAAIEAGLRRDFRSKPVQIVWGMKDRVLLPAAISLWLQTLPQAEVIRIPDAGHFVQEDAPERAVSALVRFARTVQGPA